MQIQKLEIDTIKPINNIHKIERKEMVKGYMETIKEEITIEVDSRVLVLKINEILGELKTIKITLNECVSAINTISDNVFK